MRALRRTLGASVAYFLVIASVSMLTIGPAGAWTEKWNDVYFINGPSDLCVDSHAEQYSVDNGYVWTNGATITYHAGCGSALGWTYPYLAARAVFFQDRGDGVYQICHQNYNYDYNGTYSFLASQSNHWQPCNSNSIVGQSVSFIYVGYPPSWVQGGAYTAPMTLLGV